MAIIGRKGYPPQTPYASMIWFRFKGCFSARIPGRPCRRCKECEFKAEVKALLKGMSDFGRAMSGL